MDSIDITLIISLFVYAGGVAWRIWRYKKEKKSARLYQEAHTDNRIMDYCDFSDDGDAKNNYSDCLVV